MKSIDQSFLGPVDLGKDFHAMKVCKKSRLLLWRENLTISLWIRLNSPLLKGASDMGPLEKVG